MHLLGRSTPLFAQQTMLMKVVLYPQAADELQDAFLWYENKAWNLGNELLDEVDRSIAAIQEMPMTWPFYQERTGLRRYLLHRFPFGIIYRIVNNQVQIIALMHLRRKPGYWKNRTVDEV